MKKAQKRLKLHRETLRSLQERELPKVNGGVVWTGCLSDCTECPTQPLFPDVQGTS